MPYSKVSSKNAKVQMRSELAADWITLNVTLSNGEPAVESDTGKIKVGNGVDDWATLPYSAGGGGSGARETVTFSVASDPEDISVSMSTGYRLLRVQMPAGMRLRGYVSTAHRTSDAARPIGYRPWGDHGLQWEVVDDTDIWLPRPADGVTSDGSVNVPVAAEGATGSVTFTFVRTEE